MSLPILPAKWYLVIIPLVFLWASYVAYHKLRVRIEDDTFKRQKYLFLIGNEIYDGIKKCIYFLRMGAEGSFCYDILPTELDPQITSEYYLISENQESSNVIRASYSIFRKINHNIINEKGKLISDSDVPEARRVMVPGWTQTHIRDLFKWYRIIRDELHAMQDPHFPPANYFYIPSIKRFVQRETIRKLVPFLPDITKDEENEALGYIATLEANDQVKAFLKVIGAKPKK